MRHNLLKSLVLYTLLVAVPAFAEQTLGTVKGELSAEGDGCENTPRYIFSWSLVEGCALEPRGGTSTGAPVTLAPSPSQQWLALLDPKLSPFERDRRAILAMAGAYQTRFEFLETVGYTPGFEPSRPYQSWGTEYVYVVEDQKEFISLQHIMVMFFMNDGKVSGPVVMKHWRQDWQYQKPELLAYAGADTWRTEKLAKPAVKGTWAQAVYQVDDSPRYESYGRWQHFPNFSTWQSATTWRPLPRREYSVRSDYQVLEGINRHTILPDGWVHEQENYKVKLDSRGNIAKSMPYLAKELGVNRYQRLSGFDFSAGDEYWRATGPYWREVREQWRELIDKNAHLQIRRDVAGIPMYQPLFDYAQKLQDGRAVDKNAQAFVRDVLADYVVAKSIGPVKP